MGVALFSPSEMDFEKVLHEADIALYKSKSDGRNCWTLYDERLGSAAAERRVVEREIKDAIESKQFLLHYQPRVGMATGRIVSAEALVRWNHPERGLIQPASFIELCEETGMILDLGHEIVTMGCEQCLAWHQSGLGVEVSINISPRQFDDPRLIETLRDFSRRHDFPKGRVELEITENVLIGDLTRIETKLEQIVELGFGIAVDDFGTGYSNLSYISRFPLQCIKIDRSFVRQLPGSGPIIGLIQTLAHQIGAYAVAEGVETEEECRWLREQGCDQVQGFYYYPPMPPEEFEALLPQGERKPAS